MKILKLVFKLVLFAFGVFVIVGNRKNIGLNYLSQMFVGLGILLYLVYDYNKQFK